MQKEFEGKVALITGSTSGIGLAVAETLAQKGAHIMLNGFGDMTVIKELQMRLQHSYGVTVEYSGADLTHVSQIQDMVHATLQLFSRIDILVNNAGIQHVAPIEEFPIEKWDQILALNLSAAFHTMKAVLPVMTKNGWGRIVNVASAHGLVASPFKSAYVAAKHGLVGLTKVVALETAEKNITVNAVCPGYVETPLVQHQISEQAKAYNIPEERVVKEIILKTQPNRKFIKPEHLAALIAFICSEAGESMTGEIVSMDGAWTAC